jgi:6-phosphogluconate dehydrogenase
MQAVAAMRNQFGGHAVRTPAPKGGDVEDGGAADQTETAKKAGAGSAEEPGES